MQNQLEELTNGCMRFCPSKRIIEAVSCEIARGGISILPCRIFGPTSGFNYKRPCPLYRITKINTAQLVSEWYIVGG